MHYLARFEVNEKPDKKHRGTITKIVVASLANVTWERLVKDPLWTDKKLLKHQYRKQDAWITKEN